MKTKVLTSAILGIGLNILLLGSCINNPYDVGANYYPVTPVTPVTHSSTLPSRISHSTVNIPNSLLTPAVSAIPTVTSWENPAMQTLETLKRVTSGLSKLENPATISTPMTSSSHSEYLSTKSLATSGVLSTAVSRHPQPTVLPRPAVFRSNEGFQTSLLDKPLMKVETRVVFPE